MYSSRSIYTILSLSFIILGSVAHAGSIDPAVTEALKTQSKIRVIVGLKDKVSQNNLKRKSSVREIKRTLMAGYQLASEGVLNSIERFSKTNSVEVLDQNWAGNSLWLEADGSVIEQLMMRNDVEEIILDYKIQFEEPIEIMDATPEDEEWTYGLLKVGVPETRAAYGLTGKGIRVGVLDTGIDPEHPDLKGKILAWKDFAGNAKEAKDAHGHGTHCAGTIAGGNADGKHIGVAPEAKLLIGRIFGDNGGTSLGKIHSGMKWMADPDGNPSTSDNPHIVSNSWGGPQRPYFFERTSWKIVETWRALGIVPVFAAGNSGDKPKTMGTPGGFPHSFAVGATDSSDEIAYFSSRGPIKWKGESYIKPDISAPGVRVLSAKPGGGYQLMSGTSMACPHVSGLAALLKQANPALGVSEIEELLMETAEDFGDEGKDNVFGKGRANIKAAVDYLKSNGFNHKDSFKKLYK